MANIANLLITLGVDTGKFKTDLNRADKNARRATRRMADNIETNITRIGKTIAGVGVTMAGTFAAMSKQQVNVADQAGKLATRLGTTSEAISQMGFVAEQTGVSTETLNMGLQRMRRRIAEAAQGSGEAVNALKELGLSAQDLNRLAPEQQFEAIADAMQGVTSEGDRVRLAMKLFDAEGVSLIQTMQNGSEAIRALRDRADELGVTISSRTAQQAADFNDRLNEIKRSVTGATNSIVADMLPSLIQAAENFQNWLEETNAVETALGVLRSTASGVVSVFNTLKDAVITLTNNFKILAAAATAVVAVKVAAWATTAAAGLGKVALGIRAINLLIKSNPIIAIGTALIAAAAAANKFAEQNAGLGRILARVSEVLNNQVEQILQAIAGFFGLQVEGSNLQVVLKVLGSAFVGVATGVAIFVEVINSLISAIGEIASGLLVSFGAQLQGLNNILKGIATTDMDLVKRGFDQLKESAEIVADSLQNAGDDIVDLGGRIMTVGRNAGAALKELWAEQETTTENTGLMTLALQRMRETMDAVVVSYEDGTEATEEVSTEAERLEDRIRDLRDRFDETRPRLRNFAGDLSTVATGLLGGKTSMIDMWEAMGQLDVKAEETGTILESMAERAGERIGDAFFNLFDSLEGGFDGLKDAAQNALKSIVSANLQETLGKQVKGMMDSLMSSVGGGGGMFGSIIGGGATGFSATGDVAGAIGGAVGAAIGTAIGGPIGGQIGSMLGSLVGGLFGGGGTPEIRLSTDQADRARSDFRTGSAQSAFGEFFIQTDNVSGDARDGLPGFVDAVEQFDQRISALLSPEQINRAADALQSSTQTLFDSLDPKDILPDRLQVIADAVDPVVGALSAGFDDLQRKADAFQAGLQILDFIEADFAAALDEIRNPQQDFLQGLRDQAEALVTLAQESDGSLQSIQDMAQGTQNLRQNIVQFVASLESARVNIQQGIAETIRQLELEQAGGIESRQGFVMEAGRLQSLVESIGTLTDPGQIQYVIQQITQLSQQLLGAAQSGNVPMRGIEGLLGFSDMNGLIEFLRGVEDQATGRIDDLQQSAVEIAEATQEATREAIIDGFQPAVDGLIDAGGRIENGGNNIDRGAQNIEKAARLFASGANVRVEVGGWEVNPIGRGMF